MRRQVFSYATAKKWALSALHGGIDILLVAQHQVREDTDIHLLPPLLQKILVQMITAKGNLSLSCRSLYTVLSNPRVSGTR
jgi:hypothetical protein